jgi:hypothetical protein
MAAEDTPMRRLLTAGLAVSCWLAAAAAAQAGFTFTFTNANDIPSGGQNTINVFLHWDGTGTNVIPSPGLAEADFGIRLLSASPGTVTVANPTGSDVTPNSGFDFTQKYGPTGLGFTPIAGYTNLAAIQQGLISNSPVTSPGDLILGSFKLTAGTNNTASPLAVTIQAYFRNTQTADNFQDANGVPMDQNVLYQPFLPGNTTFNVTGVPEPGTLALTGLALAGPMIAAWRRRTRTTSAVAAD